MKVGFGAEHESIREEFRKLLASAPRPRFGEPTSSGGRPLDAALWRQLAELGWLATAIPEAHGGSGLDRMVLCVLAEEIGRSMAAVPFTASICGYAVGLKLAGHADTLASALPRIADGTCVGVLLSPDCWEATPRLVPGSGGATLLCGIALNVLDGACATEALACVEDGDAWHLVRIDLAHATRRGLDAAPLDLLHPAATLDFEGVPVDVLASGAAAERSWKHILDTYGVFVAFEQLGGAESALEMARQHSLQRYAFGRAIGSFQAIKHMLADMLVSVELARSNCHFGAAALSMGPELVAEAASVARISATDAFRHCARGNIQIHGALGVTWESECHLYYRRAQALAGSPGSPRFWKERLIELLVRRRAQPAVLAEAAGALA
jgi:acyl-CoA dehydrogenase